MLYILLKDGTRIPLFGKSLLVIRSNYDAVNFYNNEGTDRLTISNNGDSFKEIYKKGRAVDVIIVDAGINRRVIIHTMTPVIIILDAGIRNNVFFISDSNSLELSMAVFIGGIENIVQCLPNQQEGEIIDERGAKFNLSNLTCFNTIDIK